MAEDDNSLAALREERLMLEREALELEKKRFEEMIVLFIWLVIPLSLSLMSDPRFMMGSFFPVVVFTDFLEKHSKVELAFISLVILIVASGLYLLWLQEAYILV